MQDSYNNITPTNNISNNASTVVKTDEGSNNGQNKCPKCGSTDISVNSINGHLRCNFCRYEFELEKITGMQEDISKLTGQVMTSGTQDIVADANDIVTLKCSSCGAEVVIDTASAVQARCHWCRNTLSINEQIPNGSIPDVVLPFAVSKEDAKSQIEKFVGKRKFFAHPKFTKEFTTENIMGVYFPYMVIDVNAHSTLIGQGEHKVRQYTRKEGDKNVTYYDAKNKKMLDKDPDNSASSELNAALMENTYGFKMFSSSGKYGLMIGNKIVIPCEYTEINLLGDNLFNYMQSKGKNLILLEKDNKTILYNVKNSKSIITFDSNNVRDYNDSTFIEVILYANGSSTRTGYMVYNLLTGKSMTFDKDNEVFVESNYIEVKKDKKTTYYNTKFKQIYVTEES